MRIFTRVFHRKNRISVICETSSSLQKFFSKYHILRLWFFLLQLHLTRLQGHSIPTSRISQKRCVLGTKLLKNTNRKPYPIFRMVSISLTLSDLWAGFQGHDIFQHWISTKWHEIEPYSYYRWTRIRSHMRSIERWHYLVSEMTYTVLSGTLNSTIPYHYQRPWRILNPVFQGHGIFEVEYLKQSY